MIGARRPRSRKSGTQIELGPIDGRRAHVCIHTLHIRRFGLFRLPQRLSSKNHFGLIRRPISFLVIVASSLAARKLNENAKLLCKRSAAIGRSGERVRSSHASQSNHTYRSPMSGFSCRCSANQTHFIGRIEERRFITTVINNIKRCLRRGMSRLG